MAFRLIPREERFFDDFVALAEQIQRGAGLLEQMLAPDRPVWDKADEIKEVEHKCDFLTHEIIQRLHRTFVTPLDREDSHTLARSLDDVMDAIDASATVLRLYHIESVRPGARELSRLVRDSVEQVVCAMKALDTPSPIFQRVLLFLNPEFGTSVEKVYRISRMYDRLTERSALETDGGFVSGNAAAWLAAAEPFPFLPAEVG